MDVFCDSMSAIRKGTAFRIAVAGGGTGGHTAPIVAVVDELRQRYAGPLEVLWLGTRAGPEALAAASRSVPFVAVPAGKLRRYLDLRNVIDMLALPYGLWTSLALLRKFEPAVLFSSGGYVSFLPTLAACLLRVPILVHEQTAKAGLATRIEGRLADRVAVSFPSSEGHFPKGKVFFSGNPVRREAIEGRRSTGLALLGFKEDLPVVYVTGGIQGAHAINRVVGECLPELLAFAQVVHQCGRQPAGYQQDLPWLLSRIEGFSGEMARRYVVKERFGSEIGHIYAAADLVVGRAGAGTIFEVAAHGKPALFIPLPGSAAGEQRLNAAAMEALGAAVIVDQSRLSPQRLLADLRELLSDRDRLRAMGEKGRQLYRPDAAAVLADALLELGRAK